VAATTVDSDKQRIGDAFNISDLPSSLTISEDYAFRMRDDAPFAFAWLWDAWKEPSGDWLQSYSLITPRRTS
jgi:putative SOS response-associated peptidase YedK